MKKIIAMLLALAMCFSLCACGKSEAVTNVEGLIDAIGEVTAESESAITAAEEAYNALTEEEKVKVENYAILTAAKDSFLKAKICGEWARLDIPATFTFNEDGQYTFKSESETLSGDFSFTDKGIEIPFEYVLDLVYQEKDGIAYLTSLSKEPVYELVKAEYATTTEHEINIDNWQNYFAIEEKTLISKNGFGEIDSINLYQVLELKEEYRRRLAATEYDGLYSIAIESSFTREAALCEVNGEELSYVECPRWASEDSTEIRDINQYDIGRYYNVNNTDDNLYGVSIAGGYSWISGDEEGVYLIKDLEINRICGTLLLYDLPLNSQMRKNTDKTVLTVKGSVSAVPPAAEMAPDVQAPLAEAPVAEAPVAEAPVAEAPVAEAPVAEAPVAEAPAAEAPMAESPAA